uniref:Uncharacterized protein n=1 Tax=Brassica oleracea var. oleracea TaxID=109376 RepID=A0A0D3D8Q2_BRAOL
MTTNITPSITIFLIFLGLLRIDSFPGLETATGTAASVPAVYVLGDSLVDAGNNNYLAISISKANYPHNGVDFPGSIATGRFCNGKNAADAIAEKFGLPLPPPYLSLKGIFKEEERKAAALSGVNFASGGAGIFNGSDQQFLQLEYSFCCSEESSFVVDKARRGRMVTLETTTPLEKLKRIDSSTNLCVTFSGLGVNQKERVNIDLNKEPCDSSNVEDEEVLEINRADFVKPSKESCDRRKDHVAADGSGDVGLRSENNGDSEKDGRAWRGDFVKKDQIFRSKGVLKATMEILAMKNNFDYTVFKSTRKWWYIRCKDALCN